MALTRPAERTMAWASVKRSVVAAGERARELPSARSMFCLRYDSSTTGFCSGPPMNGSGCTAPTAAMLPAPNSRPCWTRRQGWARPAPRAPSTASLGFTPALKSRSGRGPLALPTPAVSLA